MQKIYLLYLLLLFTSALAAQDGLIGQGFSTGFNNPSDIAAFSTTAGGSQIYETTSSGTGNQFFRLLNGTNELSPFGCVDADWSAGEGFSYDNMPTNCNGFGAFFINVPNTTDTYVFKTPSAADNDFIYFVLEGSVPEFDPTLTGRIPDGNPVDATETVSFFTGFDIPVPNGATAYLRYSLDGFTTSTVEVMEPVAGSLNQVFVYDLAPPANNQGKTLSYYFFLSGDGTGAAPQADGSDADYRTIRLQTDVAGNYSFMYDMTLPVTYRDWSGHRSSAGVELNWATATELNASHFTLECSEDNGRSWNVRTQIPANNVPTGAAYTFVDRLAPSTTLKYRLRQTDFDGSYIYSSILPIAGENSDKEIRVWPQPATNYLNLQLTELPTRGQMTLYASDGRLVESRSVDQLTERFATAGLVPGIYWLRLTDVGGLVINRKVVVN